MTNILKISTRDKHSGFILDTNAEYIPLALPSLHNSSNEDIRKNWDRYSKIYEGDINILWNSWYDKYSIKKTSKKVIILKDFIMDDNELLIMKGLTNKKRLSYHVLCDNIGLHHVSITKNNKRNLHISKPKIWLWEFTLPNPLSKPHFHSKSYSKQEQNDRRIEQMKRKYCRECNTHGSEVELFCSGYINGIYCESCLENISDGEGGYLSDHKFEPL